ncbi:Protein AF-9 [Heterocephalus glaber]|uniref:Protein AF-9 n=1 Tax=Heterocephalus glaber TaxID=10181 RepID=G5B880_HETGA|nr:Protein AF-9 [Heterocephalus glaber]
MASSLALQVKLELGHCAQVQKKPTVEGFIHDWMVFVCGPQHSNIQHFVEKVIFHLHESFPRPRVCKDPPYKAEESGYAGFILPIEVYFKNKEEPARGFSSTCSADKVQIKDESHVKMGRVKIKSEVLEKKKSTLPPFDDIMDPEDSDMEENMSPKSDSEQPSPASSSSSSSSSPSFTLSQTRQQGPLWSIMKDLHSDDNEEESDEAEDNDNDSEMERPVNRGGSQSHRVSLSDGSDSESSSASAPLHHEPPPSLIKTNNHQILEVKSPIKQSKSDKQIKNGECDKAYLDKLVELHGRLMMLRERHILQQIVNVIEETGHFHITNPTFDFDLCSLDKTTVRKLQSYLETSGTS